MTELSTARWYQWYSERQLIITMYEVQITLRQERPTVSPRHLNPHFSLVQGRACTCVSGSPVVFRVYYVPTHIY